MRGRGVLAAMLATLVPIVATSVARAGTDTGAPGIVITSPSPAGFTSYGGIRLQAIGSLSNTADELLGAADLNPAATRIDLNFTVPRFVTNGNSASTAGDCAGNYRVGTLPAPAANTLTLTWDAAADTLTSRLVDTTLDCTAVLRNFAQVLATANGWTLARARTALTGVDALRIMLDDRQAGSTVTLRGATVDGNVGLGTFDPGAGSTNTWLGTGYDFDAPAGFSFSATVNLGGSFGTCTDTCAIEVKFGHFTPPYRPPVVRDHAADVTGHEGETLETRGAFTDPDGDPLSITGSGAGTVRDHGDGTWSWQYLPPDDGSGSVSVTASDGKGGTATDVFSWVADNVPPTIASLTPSATTVLAGADVTWTVVATDPGIDDTFMWWFDGGAGVPGGLTTTYTTSYT